MARGSSSNSNASLPDSAGVRKEESATREFPAISQEQYDELKRIAWILHRRLRVRNLTRTALVHDALIKLHTWSKLPPPDDPRFKGFVAQAMRHVLVDAVRRSLCAMHGGGIQHVTLTDRVGKVTMPPVEFLDVNRALDELVEVNARQADAIVYVKFFGYTLEEAAAELNVDSRTVQRHVRAASAWIATKVNKGKES
jgi:RNA polymerase sigma factor (TIGR02999 family)